VTRPDDTWNSPPRRHRRQASSRDRVTRPKARQPAISSALWASEQGIALGQVATDAKSNEITAILQPWKADRPNDTPITIDAGWAARKIVKQIVTGGGDRVIAVSTTS